MTIPSERRYGYSCSTLRRLGGEVLDAGLIPVEDSDGSFTTNTNSNRQAGLRYE